MKRILTIVFLLFPYFAWAGIWYVDNLASGLNNGNSWQNAWGSFADIVWNKINSGDTIFISGGSHSKNYFEALIVGASGAFKKPITITGGIDDNHDGTVIIDGEDKRNCIVVENEHHVEISYIRCDNGKGETIRVDESESIKIDSCVFENINTQGAVTIEESFDCIISFNIITTEKNTSTQVDGIYAQKNDGNIYENNHIKILNNNYAPHCDAIQLFQEKNFIVRGNTIIVENASTANKQGIFCTNNYGQNYIYNNLVIYDTEAYASLIGFINFSGAYTGTVQIYNNTSVSLSGAGWAVAVIGDSNAKIKNNIFLKLNSNSTPVLYGESGNKISFVPGNVDYNLYYAKGATDIISYNGTTLNLIEWQNLNHGANSVNASAGLDSEYKPDDPNDPPVDSGINLSAIFTKDLDGNRRGQGSAWDIGAYEYPSGNSGGGGGGGG
jgi:hypothetical protein